MKKLIAILLSVAMMVCVLAACSNSSNDDSTSGNQVIDNSTAGNNDGSSNNESIMSTDVSSDDSVVEDLVITNTKSVGIEPWALKNGSVVAYYIYEMLYGVENGMGSDLVPVIADPDRGGNNVYGVGGFDHEDGSTEYTFYIRDNVYDSAGNHITASDVVFSFEMTYAYGETSGWGSIEGWEAVDDTTILMTTNRELDQKGEIENIILRCFIVSEAAYNASPSQLINDGCGTGHYILTDFESGASATLELNEDYWDTSDNVARRSWGNVETVKFIVISEDSQVALSLKSGDINFGDTVSSTLIDDFLDGGAYGDQYDVYTMANTGGYFLEPNCSEESVMGDLNLRLAIFYALNNNDIVTGAGATAYTPLTAFGPGIFGDYNDEWDTWENYNTVTDLDLAKQYLEASNYNGEDINFLYISGNETIPTIIMNVLNSQLGVNVKLVSYDRSAINTYLADPTAWDIYYSNMNASDYLVNLWSHQLNTSNTTTGLTEGFIDDPHYQELLETCLNVNSTMDDYDTYWQYTLDNAYIYGVVSSYTNYVYPVNMTSIYRIDKANVLLGACTYGE